MHFVKLFRLLRSRDLCPALIKFLASMAPNFLENHQNSKLSYPTPCYAWIPCSPPAALQCAAACFDTERLRLSKRISRPRGSAYKQSPACRLRGTQSAPTNYRKFWTKNSHPCTIKSPKLRVNWATLSRTKEEVSDLVMKSVDEAVNNVTKTVQELSERCNIPSNRQTANCKRQ